MTTIALTSTPLVAASSTTSTTTTAVPTVSSYATWYEASRINWTTVGTDVITCTGWVVATLSSITCTGTNQLSVYTRARLHNETTGADVWSGTATHQLFRQIGTVAYTSTSFVSNHCNTFGVGGTGLLIAGNAYSWHVEIMKEQSV